MQIKQTMKKSANIATQEDVAYDDLEMSVLHKISRAVVLRKNVSELMDETLSILHSEMGLLRGTITMRDGNYLFIEASHGMDAESIKRGVYKIGEGVTGKVAASARSIIIEDISKDADFLNRTKARGEILKNSAFVCVPIVYIEQVIGTLSIDRPHSDAVNLTRDCELLETVANILADALARIYFRHEERNRLLDENRRLKLELSAGLMRPKNIVGNCGAMQKVYNCIAKYSSNQNPIFIRGEAGTGKELAARACADPAGIFRVVNCAALPDYALISEIFGYEKQSPTKFSKRGLFEDSQSGTVFFDEVAEMSLPAQRMLSDYIRTGTFRRINGKTDITARVRVICASSADIEKMLSDGTFDRALYEQIAPQSIHIPALRDRKSDILLLAEHFLEKYNAIYKKNIKRISSPAGNMLIIYPWKNNVRELENCIERAVMSTHDDAISGYNLPKEIRSAYTTRKLPFGEEADFGAMKEAFERDLISEALRSTRGNAAAAARILNLSQRILNYKIKNYSINTAWFKNQK